MELAKPITEFLNQTNEIKNDIGYDVNQRLDKTDQSSISPMREGYEPDRRLDSYYSTEAERIKWNPLDGERGKWEDGERGNGTYVPNVDSEKGKMVADALKEFDIKGITYKNSIPDFSKCAKATVTIDNMTENIVDNFNQADEQLAEQWNKEMKDSRIDWEAREIKDYRKEHQMSWHECSDMKTCMLVDRKIHDYFRHTGGRFECKKRNELEGGNA